MTTWEPETYLEFEDERLQPGLDLLARVNHPAPDLVVDLGCGPGNVTARLARRWPDAELVGVDSSPEMLELALRAHPELAWVEADATTWKPPRPADVIFSNSVFHWVLGHEALFPTLIGRLAPGGVLAVQVPANWSEPCHAEAFAIAGEPRWRDRLVDALPPQPILPPERYHELLTPITSERSVWVTTYFHVLEGPDPVVAWFKGSLLRAFLSRLDPADGDDFVAEYARRMAIAFPPRADGRTVLPFHRLFVVGRRPG